MINKTLSPKTDVVNLKLIFTVIAVILTVLLGFASVQSFLSYRSESHELRELDIRHSRLEKDFVSLGNLIEQYTREQEKFQKLLFQEQDVPLFLEEIALFASDAKVKILDVKTRTFVKVKYLDPAKAEKNKKSGPKEEDQGLVLSSLPVQVNIQGTFESIVKFLMKLERYKQLLTLSDVEIKLKEYPQLLCSLTVSIYSLREMKTGMAQ